MQKHKIEEAIEFDPDLIDIGDQINIDVFYDENDIENMNLLLTENTFDLKSGEISIKSPIGELIYLKKPGFSGYAIINNLPTLVTINKKITKEKKKSFK